MEKHRKLCRSDLCWVIGARASRLTGEQAAIAWTHLAGELQQLGESVDMPKFRQLLEAVRASYLVGSGVYGCTSPGEYLSPSNATASPCRQEQGGGIHGTPPPHQNAL